MTEYVGDFVPTDDEELVWVWNEDLDDYVLTLRETCADWDDALPWQGYRPDYFIIDETHDYKEGDQDSVQ